MTDSRFTPAVSIILPSYNRAKFLPQAFASIKAQQFTDWELIVVDDGSTDNTRELVEELTRDWSQPARYVYQENQGAYGARNTGLDLAGGEYVGSSTATMFGYLTTWRTVSRLCAKTRTSIGYMAPARSSMSPRDECCRQIAST